MPTLRRPLCQWRLPRLHTGEGIVKLLQTTHPANPTGNGDRQTPEIRQPGPKAELHFIEWGQGTVTITWILR